MKTTKKTPGVPMALALTLAAFAAMLNSRRKAAPADEPEVQVEN